MAKGKSLGSGGGSTGFNRVPNRFPAAPTSVLPRDKSRGMTGSMLHIRQMAKVDKMRRRSIHGSQPDQPMHTFISFLSHGQVGRYTPRPIRGGHQRVLPPKIKRRYSYTGKPHGFI